jgi:hypothetical protein
MKKITNIEDCMGKKITNIVFNDVKDPHYETLTIFLEDDSFIDFCGGGYDGYGDYIDLFDRDNGYPMQRNLLFKYYEN